MTLGPSRNAARVQFVGVSKIYATGHAAIASLDLDIRAGEFLTLLGPSGSGKTTALNLLAGFQTPTSGQILVDEKDVGALPPHKRDIGVVFQHYALFPHMTVRENIGYPLKQRGVAKEEIRRQVDEALRMVSLRPLGNRVPRQLSGGQQQRVAVARAIVFRPRLLLMDEPLGALDRKLRESVQLELKRIHRDLGVTIVFVTHDQDEALVMSDRITIFDAGRIQQTGTAQELYDQPLTQFVAEFLGDSNCLVGDVNFGEAQSRLVAPAGELIGTTTTTTPRGARGAIVVRPERCRLFTEANAVPSGWNFVPANIRDVIYLGSLRKVVCGLTDGQDFMVVCRPEDTIPVDSSVFVGFAADSARIISAKTP
jgi:putative spermidine/putrescine transport system ATP-binding protein